MWPVRLLILGGSSEASAIARAIANDARFDATLSLAGRTRNPAPSPVRQRLGGFGGAQGLARWLSEARIDKVIDATHPFAVQMKRNVVEAARLAALPLLAIRRPPWQPAAGDAWIEVADMDEAAATLGADPKRVFLTVGQKELASFAAAPQHIYILRSVDPPPPETRPAQSHIISARGPFAEHDECRLLQQHRIEVLVTKNSGGIATQAKLLAARALRLPVIMVRRPQLPAAPYVETVEAALDWLRAHHIATSIRRGV